MKGSSKLLVAAGVCAAMGMSTFTANATDIDVTATLTASAAVAVANNANIDFGGVDFTAGHIGNIELGPDGNAALVGPTNLTLTGATTAGELAITENSGMIDVTCDATAIIDDGNAGPLTLTTIVWDTDNTNNYGAAANTCMGLGAGVQTLNVTATPNPTIYVGAELTIGNDDLVGSTGSTPFNTATGTGDPITFRLVFQ